MHLYANASGEIIRVLDGPRDMEMIGPPDRYTSTLEFDPATNQHVVNGLDTDWDSHMLRDGVLYRNGEPVTINPPGAAWRARDRQETAEQQARNIPGWATWTEAEAAAWLEENIADLLAALPDIDTLTGTQYRNNAQAIDAQFQDVLVAQAQAIRALARMVLALRNKAWPELEGDE